jgi:hypothetical protein
MKIVITVCTAGLFFFFGCTKVQSPKVTDGEQTFSLEAEGDTSVPFFVNSAFPDGDSLMKAARRVFPDVGKIALGRFWIGADTRYQYAVVFTGLEIKGGFESTYFRYLTFVKQKTAGDWSNARVFDWIEVPMGPFSGPIEVLEAKGEELGKTPNKAPEPTTRSVTPRATETKSK